MAAKPPTERSEANKVPSKARLIKIYLYIRQRSHRPSEARLIKCISTYTCNTIKSTAAKPLIERSEFDGTSWGWDSKFLIFWGVGGMKFEFWWAGKLIFWEGGGIKFEFWWGVLIVRIGRYI